MYKKELDVIMAESQFPSIGETDMLFGKSASAGKFGFFPANMLSGNSYACRRWKGDYSTSVGEVVGNVDYLRQLPSLLGLGCYLVDDVHNRKKLSPSSHYRFADGMNSAIDGSMGQYMWGWRTPFYMSIWREGDYKYKAISLKPIPGRLNWRIPVASVSAIGAGVMDRTNDILVSVVNTSEQYRGGNGYVLDYTQPSAELLSQLGYPATTMGTATFEAKAAKRGAGWGAGWYWIDTVISVLFEIIMGTKNVQSAFNPNKDANGLYQGGLGPGFTSKDMGTFCGYYPSVPCSAGVELADGVGIAYHDILNADGSVFYSAPVPVFFGLKNWYGHLWRGKNRIVAVKQSDMSYKFYVAKSSLTEWNYQDIDNMIEVGSWLPSTPGSWNYIKELNYTGLAGMPSVDGASSSTYHADGCYGDTSTSGFRSPLGSGSANSGGYAGLVCFYGGTAPSVAAARLSSPLCECAEDFDPRGKVYSD
ncbi:MAG: hypothetical protein ACI4AI_05430 [Paludibacteraceae bacterium]